MSTVSYPHIEVNDSGQAYIVGEGFRFKVRLLVQEHVAWGADAAKLQEGHPELTLSQIHCALAYYYDHKSQLDSDIAEGLALAEQMRAEQAPSSLTEKARAVGKELP